MATYSSRCSSLLSSGDSGVIVEGIRPRTGRAYIFVVPSTTDTFGNVILEAQACGMPVIVSDSGGPKELVEDRTNGLITRSRDVNDFTQAIRSLVTDPAWRERMGNAARKSVTDRSWPNAFRKFWSTTDT